MESDDDKTRTHAVLTKGTMVSHYRIARKIGAGGMGEVYLAEDTKLSRNVALKFLPTHLCDDEDCRERFKREAQAAAGLDHPNIAGIHEVGEYSGRPFYSMQVIQGQSLKDVIAGKDLPIERILEIAIQVCEGLQAAHDKGIIHRDVKPSNILIDGHGRVRIVDFGLASIRGSEHLTKTGSTLGTIGYMSPEQVQGKGIDHRSDLFSLGVVLYELITKQNPFKRDSEAATLKAVSDDTPHPLARFRSNVPDGLQNIIDKALEKDVKTRCQHADGLLADLMRVKRSLESGQSSVSERMVSARSSRTWWAVALIVVAAAIVLIVTKPWQTETASDKPDKIRLVVLPFENLGNPEDEYFADGITDEITSRLARLSALGVISRSSAIQYKNTEKGPKQIAEELDVDFILEGTIRWDKSGPTDRVRITPQLIEVTDNTHLWAENYEREISAIFDVQVEIASNIVTVLDVTLIQQEQIALAEKPTDNVDAYQAYLKGMSLLWEADYTAENMGASIKLLERAIGLDPLFVEAQAALADAHSNVYHFVIDRTENRLEMARTAIDRALDLDAGHPDVLLAEGTYYYVQRDYARALELFDAARKKSPGDLKAVWAIAATYRRQGRFDEAIREFNKYLEMSPRSAFGFLDLGFTYAYLHRHREADSCFDRAISLAPDQNQAYIAKADLHQHWYGDISTARKVLESAPGGLSVACHTWWVQGLLERDYEAALNRLSERDDEFIDYQLLMLPVILCAAECYRLMGETEMARIAYDSARALLEPMVENMPDDPRRHLALSIAYAGLDRKESAIREADLIVELMPLEKDAIYGTYVLRDKAYTYVMVGEYEKAIDIFEYVMSIPHAYFGLGTLRLDPRLDPLRDHPRFQALIEKYEKEYGI